MKSNLWFYLLLSIILVACAQNRDEEHKPLPVKKQEPVAIQQDYDRLMKSRGIVLYTDGKCEDALMDTLHERNRAYIENQSITDSILEVNFKFKEACCQEYAGDYSLNGDTLVFEYMAVNDEACACICWYKYRLVIHADLREIKNILVRARAKN